jgi:hypothetical protein
VCFLSEPAGKVYEAPLVEIWNSPVVVAKRSRMLAGRYGAAGCCAEWCGRREALREFERLAWLSMGLQS